MTEREYLERSMLRLIRFYEDEIEAVESERDAAVRHSEHLQAQMEGIIGNVGDIPQTASGLSAMEMDLKYRRDDLDAQIQSLKAELVDSRVEIAHLRNKTPIDPTVFEPEVPISEPEHYPVNDGVTNWTCPSCGRVACKGHVCKDIERGTAQFEPDETERRRQETG